MLNGKYGGKTFRKTFLSYTAILIIPLIVFGALNMHRNVLEEQKEIYRKHESDARRIADNMDGKLRELKNMGEFLSEETWVKKLMPDGKVFEREFDLFDDLEIRRVLQNAVSGTEILSFGAIVYPDNGQVISPWGVYGVDSFFSSVASFGHQTLPVLYDSFREYHFFDIMHPVEMKLWNNDTKVIPVLQSLEVVNHPRAVLALFIDCAYLTSFMQRIGGTGPSNIVVTDGNAQIYGQMQNGAKKIAGESQKFTFHSQIGKWQYDISYSNDRIGTQNMLGSLLAIMISAVIGTALAFLLAKISYRPLGILLHKLSSAIRYDPSKNDISPVCEYHFIEKSFEHLMKENDSLQQAVKDYESAAKSNLLLTLLKGYFPDDRQIDWLKKFGLDYNDDMHFCTLLIHFHYEHDSSDLSSIRKIAIVTFLVAEKVMNRYRIDYQLFEVTNADKAVILSADQPFALEGVNKIAAEIAEEIKKSCGIQPEVLCGTVEKGLIGISKSYYAANEHLQYMLFSRRNIHSAGDVANTDVAYYYPTDWEVQLINNLKIGNLDRLVHILDEIKAENGKRNLSEHCTIKLVSLIMETMLRVLHELNIDAGIYARQFASKVKTGAIEPLWSYVYETGTLICERVRYSNTSSEMELGSKLLLYVNQNYTDANMSLKMLAEVFHMSVSAVSKTFKEVTGINFYDYLCRLRMELAKELLREKKCGIDDVAHQVGYENVYSFKRAFVRYEGIKPDEYALLSEPSRPNVDQLYF